MVQITKSEAFELQKLGYKFGNEGELHHTVGVAHKYYLTETKKAMYDLKKIRDSKTTYVKQGEQYKKKRK